MTAVLRRLVGYCLVLVAVLGEIGTLQDRDPISQKIGLSVFFLLLLSGGAWLIWSASTGDKRRAAALEQHKLLALASEGGTLSSPRIVAALGFSKEEADAALGRLRHNGLVELDLDEAGAPVYRVSKDALAGRQR